MKNVSLNPRLRAIADLVPKGAKLADIGTDHGYLPIYCVQKEICDSCIASDIRPGPLSSAMKHAKEYGVSDRIRFCCASGLTSIMPGEVDTIVIAGMGGETIKSILQNAPWIQSAGVLLILEPQSKVLELQHFLTQCGFILQSASLVEDCGRLYPIWSLNWSSDFQLPYAPFYLDSMQGELLFSQYCTELLNKIRIRLSGLNLSGKNCEESAEIQYLFDQIKRIYDDYSKTDI